MSRETAEAVIKVLAQSDIPTLDITGSAPEMNPSFRWLVERATRLGRRVIDRCNLTILPAPGFTDLPEFLAQHQVEFVASLPMLTFRSLLWMFGPCNFEFDLISCGIDDDRQTMRDRFTNMCLVNKSAEPIGTGEVHLAYFNAFGYTLAYPHVCHPKAVGS
jgi:hypothetical protein